MEDSLIEVPAMRSWVKIVMINEGIADRSTILVFCHLLDKQDLGKLIFDGVKGPSQAPWHGDEAARDH